jgi:hypothetical protein
MNTSGYILWDILNLKKEFIRQDIQIES